MMALSGWCTPQAGWRIRPFRVPRPNWKAACAERACSVWSGGKAVKPYLSLPCWSAEGGRRSLPWCWRRQAMLLAQAGHAAQAVPC